MKVQDAVIILERLRRSSQNTVPLAGDDTCPLTPERVVRDKQGGHVIIKYVNRLKYMAWLKHKFNLVEKGSNLRNLMK